MNHVKQNRYGFASLFFVLLIALTGSTALAQQETKNKKDLQDEVKKPVKESGRDPFRKYEPPRLVLKKPEKAAVPSIQERIEQYRAQKIAAMNAHVPAPKPTTALLLSEIQVVGISRTPRGYAAIVEATPIKLSYVVYPGEKFYDGQLVAIEDSRLVFRHETVWTDGRRERTAELKPLRQQSAIEAMTAVKPVPTNPPVAENEKKPEDKPATDKP